MARSLLRRFGSAGTTLAVVATVALATTFGTGTASAQVDNLTIVTTPRGLTIEAEITWMNFQFVRPLDGNPTSREWFQDGVLAYRVSGPGADSFKGTVAAGYHVGYPFSTGTVSVTVDNPAFLTQPFQPSAKYSFGIGLGPGVVDVPIGSLDVSGTSGQYLIHGWHGTVTGVIGGTHIRPYLRVTSDAGETVTAYGKIWDH